MFVVGLSHRLHHGAIDGDVGLEDRAVYPFCGIIVRLGFIGLCLALRCGGASATAQQQPEDHGAHRAPLCSTVSQNETSPPDFATPFGEVRIVFGALHCVKTASRRSRGNPGPMPYWLPEAIE